MKKVKLIYNSGAGQSKFTYFLDTIIEKFMANDIEVLIYRAGERDNLEEFLKDSDNENLYGIIAAGGDGTLNRVVNIMMKYSIKTPLGVIPAGTSNDFAKHINMPNNFYECIDKILANNVKPIDVGKANDKYFINVCSAGLFTNSSQKADKNLKKALGKLSYFITGAKELFKFRPFSVKIETDEELFLEKINLFLIFNGSSVGGMTYFTSDSSIQDGLLDLVIIKNCSLHELGGLVANIMAGRSFDDKNVIYKKTKTISIQKLKGNCDKPDVDGDEGPDFPLEVTCIENGINMFL
ncbi:MAG: YegS/Rv2252/BmrU family lipid kinase [Clostridia bacterium]|nr:YegS/Rv2252/BmrU family lipid kinase [Clostridia bacterium]